MKKMDIFTSEFPSLALIKGQGWLETVAMHRCLVIAECTDIKAARPTVDRRSGQHSGSRTQNRVASRWPMEVDYPQCFERLD